jgi:hypothetical protein
MIVNTSTTVDGYYRTYIDVETVVQYVPETTVVI